MAEGKLGAVESRFADIVWAHAPLASRELARLCERGLFQNDGGTVRALVSREAFYCSQGEALVDSAFGGSLPAFLAAFTRRRALSRSEIEEIQKMIDEAEA